MIQPGPNEIMGMSLPLQAAVSGRETTLFSAFSSCCSFMLSFDPPYFFSLRTEIKQIPAYKETKEHGNSSAWKGPWKESSQAGAFAALRGKLPPTCQQSRAHATVGRGRGGFAAGCTREGPAHRGTEGVGVVFSK